MPLKVEPGPITFADKVAHKIAADRVFAGFAISCLQRHLQGDWGDRFPEDTIINNNALATGGRMISSYIIPNTIDMSDQAEDDRLWVITEAAGSATTVLFPSES